METTSPPPVSPHEEEENDNQLPPITGSPATFPVDDVAHNNEQFMDSIAPSLITSPENPVDHQQPVDDGDVQKENENRQPSIAGSPAQALLIDDVEHSHEQFMDSISPSLLQSPENSVDRQPLPPPEDDENQQKSPASPTPPSPQPEEKNIDGEQPFAPSSTASLLPPSTEAEQPPENPSPNHESTLSNQPSSQPPIEAEYPPEDLPNDTSPPEVLSHNQVPSPEDEQQLPSLSPSPQTDYPPENLSLNHESTLSKQPRFQSPSPSPENNSSNHESPLSKPPPSPSPTIAEGPPDHESPSSPVELQENPKPSPSFKSKQSPKYHSPLLPHETPEPNTLTPPLGVPLLLHAAATFSPNKPQISPWTHQETTNLIQAYQEKWYSLKKGPLKAGQWEEVAITVAARCGYDEPTKTSKQCRHKIEKLRKRYRTERGKPRSKATAWNFFKLMDNLEKGPLPISSSQPMELVEYQKPSTSNGKKRKNGVYDDDGDLEFLANKRSSTSRARNSNHHVANGGLATNLRFSEGGNRIVRGLRTPVIHKRKGVYQEEREEENNENVCEEEDVAGQLAAEIKGFAEKFVKMENKKIEMMRDVERYRLEMENKRMEMIIESRQMLVETVNNAFGSSVKTHRLSAS